MTAMQRTKNERGAYTSWRKMRERCYRATDISYPNYGARGITGSWLVPVFRARRLQNDSWLMFPVSQTS